MVPAWNEAEHIDACLEALHRRLGDLAPEVIVVDDGSTDATAVLCAQWAARHPGLAVTLVRQPHRGKGAAVYAGALASHGRAVAYIDADLDVPAEALRRLWRERADARLDVVVGRRAPGAWRAGPRPLLRRAASAALGWCVRCLFRLPVSDTQTGVKLFPGDWLREVAGKARAAGFLFDVELLAVAAADGLRIGEVEVDVRMRRATNRVGLAAMTRSLLELAVVARSARRLGGPRSARRARRPSGGRAPEPGARPGQPPAGRSRLPAAAPAVGRMSLTVAGPFAAGWQRLALDRAGAGESARGSRPGEHRGGTITSGKR